MPLFSFIVPVYNAEAELQGCIDSILRQSMDDLELILVDDGSTDGSGAICDAAANADPRVSVIHQANGGVSAARNTGIRHAKGEYVLFVDGDDTVDAESLAQIRGKLHHNAADLIIFGMAFDYYRGSVCVRTEHLSCFDICGIGVAEMLSDFEFYFQGNALSSACNKVFSLDLIRKHQIFFREKMSHYEDLDFVIRYLMYIRQIGFVNAPLYHYRVDSDQRHAVSRVTDISKLRFNLSLLMGTIEEAYLNWRKQFTATQLLDTGANLYIQLLNMHLMRVNYTLSAMESLVTYCEEPAFLKLLALGAQLGEQEKHLLMQVNKRQFGAIFFRYRRKKLVASAKRWIKRVIKR